MSTLLMSGIIAVVVGAVLLFFRHPLESWNTRTQNKYFTPKDDPRPPVTEGYTYKSIIVIGSLISVVGVGLVVAGLFG